MDAVNSRLPPDAVAVSVMMTKSAVVLVVTEVGVIGVVPSVMATLAALKSVFLGNLNTALLTVSVLLVRAEAVYDAIAFAASDVGGFVVAEVPCQATATPTALASMATTATSASAMRTARGAGEDATKPRESSLAKLAPPTFSTWRTMNRRRRMSAPPYAKYI